jgi:hypothetical protein
LEESASARWRNYSSSMSSGELFKNELVWDDADDVLIQANYPYLDAVVAHYDDDLPVDLDSDLPDLNGGRHEYRNVRGPQLDNPWVIATKFELQNVRTRMVPNQEPLLLPLLKYFEAAGKAVPPELAVIAGGRSLYLLIYGADFHYVKGERLKEARLRLDFTGRKTFSAYSLFPNDEFQERFRSETKVQVGVLADGSIGVPPLPVGGGATVAAGVKASIESSTAFHWEYKVLKAKVVTHGIQSAFAEWSLFGPRRNVGRLEVRVVLIGPKNVDRVPISVNGDFVVRFGARKWWKGTKMAVTTEKLIAKQVVPT